MRSALLTQTAQVLSGARDHIDTKLMQIKDFLEQSGVGYRGSLIDDEGYPLPNINHSEILSQRQHAARLLNDRKRLEFVIEELTKTECENPLFMEIERLRPFAIVDEVPARSPAEVSGLMNADFIIKFGTANRLSDIPLIVVESQPVDLTVLRVDESGRNLINLTITPTKWSGPGLIGAHLMPCI